MKIRSETKKIKHMLVIISSGHPDSNVCTQCATDCGPHNSADVHANTGWRIVFTWLKLYFNICALIFYVCEGLSQPREPIKQFKILWYRYF